MVNRVQSREDSLAKKVEEAVLACQDLNAVVGTAGATFLHIAAAHDFLEVVERLIQLKVEVR